MMAPLTQHRRWISGRSGAAALGVACALAAGSASLAQIAPTPELRGAVAENPTGSTPRRTTDRATAQATADDTGIGSPAYEPATQRAAGLESTLPDPLAAPAPARDVFSEDIVTGPAAARDRAAQRSRPQTAAQTRRQPAGVASGRETARTRATRVEEEALTTGTVRSQRLDALDEERNDRAGTDNERTGAIDGLGRKPEEEPFSPIGLRLGTFNVTTRLDQGIGWTSNASNSPGGAASVYSETGLRLEAISDWSRHQAAIRADGTWRRSLSGERISDPEAGIEGRLRFDLGHEFSALAALGYRLTEESASDPNAVAGTASQPWRHTLTGSVGLSKDVGKLRLGATGSLTRDIYGDAELTDGTSLPQSDRNSTLATATLRAGYQISPALTPFVEGEIGRRMHDEELDSDGYARSADRYALRGGVQFDLSDKLRGEVSAGWLSERPDDARLAAISGATVAGNLAWSPVRGTTVELNASTQVETSTTAGSSGSLLYSGSLALSRELRTDLTGRALVGLDLRDYTEGGRDLVMRGEASLTWWMSRYLGVTGRARHEIQRSTLAGRDYDATSLYLGLTLQR